MIRFMNDREEDLGRMQRDKGQRGKGEVAAILSRDLGIDISRKFGSARNGGHHIEAGGFAIKVKRTERPSFRIVVDAGQRERR